jgi:hypothetical protein
MEKTTKMPPARRTREPSEELKRRGSRRSSGADTPSGPLTDRTTVRAKREIEERGPDSGQAASDNDRATRRETDKPDEAAL